METVLLTIGIVALIMGGMAVGVIFSDKPLKGSCGGVGGGGSCACEDAGTPGACKTDVPDTPVVPAQFKAPGEIMQLRRS